MSENETLNYHLEAVKENSKTVRNIYLSYLGFATYIWLTAESVTHLQLLIPQEGLSLPIIGVQLGVVGFFWVAPILLFLFHIYFAIHVWKLAELLDKVRMEVQGRVKGWQDQIPGSMFLWWFFKSRKQPWLISNSINIFVFFSFWCVVPIVLLRCQWQFLPYHHSAINLLLQILLPFSLILAFYFNSKIDPSGFKFPSIFEITANIMYPKKSLVLIIESLESLMTFIKKRWFLIFIGGFILIFSWTVLIIPKDIKENQACFATYQKLFQWIAFILKPEALIRNCENGKGLRIKSVIYRNLNLREKDLALKPGDILIASYKNDKDGLLKHFKTLDLQGRNLEFADFYKADLRKVNLRSAHLRAANLSYAQLQGAFIESIHINPIVGDSIPEGASLNFLEGANLNYAQLQGAFLRNSHLEGASLYKAQLQTADLAGAHLQGADLEGAQLQGANLEGAHLESANLSDAQLRGTYLRSARLQGAFLEDAKLQGADFYRANLGSLNMSDKEITTLINYLPQNSRLRKTFRKRLEARPGKTTSFNFSDDIKILHSFNKVKNKQIQIKDIPTQTKGENRQIQFKDIPTQTKDENRKMREKLYRLLLCTKPVILKKILYIGTPSNPLNQEDVIDYASENCPEHLPEKYGKSKNPRQ